MCAKRLLIGAILFLIIHLALTAHLNDQVDRYELFRKIWARNVYVGIYSRTQELTNCQHIPSKAYSVEAIFRENQLLCYYLIDIWDLSYIILRASNQGTQPPLKTTLRCENQEKLGCQSIMLDSNRFRLYFRHTETNVVIICTVDQETFMKFEVGYYVIGDFSLCND